MVERLRAVVVGAGQAGLTTSVYLQQAGVEHVVLDRARVAEAWRDSRWDSFRLVTQNWQYRLPHGLPPGTDPDAFMTHPELAETLSRFARESGVPLRLGVAVRALEPARGGGFRLETSTGPLHADRVVVATGPFQAPKVPPCAARLGAGIHQRHSSAYRNPEALPEGAVLVVGAGQSGWSIARELHLAGRQVHWSLGRATLIPRSYRGRDIFRWMDEIGLFAVSVDEHPGGERIRYEPRPFLFAERGGAPDSPRRLAEEGLVLHGRLIGADGTRVRFGDDMTTDLREGDDGCTAMAELIDTHIEITGHRAPPAPPRPSVFRPREGARTLDLRREGIATVIWATGYRWQWSSWIHFPVFDALGFPHQHRGVTSHPGLYFVGAHWLHTWGSGLLYGVAEDAAHVVEHLARS